MTTVYKVIWDVTITWLDPLLEGIGASLRVTKKEDTQQVKNEPKLFDHRRRISQKDVTSWRKGKSYVILFRFVVSFFLVLFFINLGMFLSLDANQKAVESWHRLLSTSAIGNQVAKSTKVFYAFWTQCYQLWKSMVKA